jgi:hypothetical protein
MVRDGCFYGSLDESSYSMQQDNLLVKASVIEKACLQTISDYVTVRV